jgi:hypothetical protein
MSEAMTLLERLRALDDETMCFDAAATYAVIREAADLIERLVPSVSEMREAAAHEIKKIMHISVEGAKFAAEKGHAPTWWPLRLTEILADCVEAIRALPVPASPWRSMETAPKGGTPVLVAVCARGTWLVGEARFIEDDPHGGGWWWANEGPDDYHAKSIDAANGPPSHWMPLPPPPAPPLKEEK